MNQRQSHVLLVLHHDRAFEFTARGMHRFAADEDR